MFPLVFRAAALSKKPAAATSIWSLHRVLQLLPPSLKTSHHHYHDHKINVSSTETIRPSSPTPAHRATFKLSLIDNHSPPFYVPFVYFYPAPASRGSDSEPGGDRFHLLKSSLAHTLTRFYPLAGRLSKSDEADEAGSIPIINCNDEGVPFSSATVDSDLSVAQFLRKRIETDSLKQFLPFPGHLVASTALESAPQIAFRATAFPCGGLAIGVCLLHKIIDAPTFADFMKLWSAFARSDDETRPLVGGGAYAHDRAATSLLPARHDDAASLATGSFMDEEGEILARRFTFDEEAVYALKARAKSDRVPDPTRTEAVAGFLWKSVLGAAARALSPDGAEPGPVVSIAGTTVNLRPRMSESWTDYSVGNIIWFAPSLYHNERPQDSLEETKTLQELVGKLRGSVAKLDKEFMGKLQGGKGGLEFLKNTETVWNSAMMTDAVKNGTPVVPFRISSVIGLRLYDNADFGWGKSAWVTAVPGAPLVKNITVLLESAVGYGVEVGLTLHEKEMAILEQDPEFLTYAKNNPPPVL